MIQLLHALLFTFCLSCLTIILAKGYIFADMKYALCKRFRKRKTIEKYLVEFIYCPMCIGVWIGIFGEIYSGIYTNLYGVMGFLLSGSLTAIIALILDNILNPSED